MVARFSTARRGGSCLGIIMLYEGLFISDGGEYRLRVEVLAWKLSCCTKDYLGKHRGGVALGGEWAGRWVYRWVLFWFFVCLGVSVAFAFL